MEREHLNNRDNEDKILNIGDIDTNGYEADTELESLLKKDLMDIDSLKAADGMDSLPKDEDKFEDENIGRITMSE